MAMKFLTFHNEFISDLAADDEQNHFCAFHIIQYAKITGAELELGQWIGP